MKTYRKQEIAIGIMFLLAMASYMPGSALVSSSFANAAHTSQLTLGVFLEFINSAVVVCIAVLLFPILKKYSERAALGYFSSRLIEAILLLIASACALLPLINPEMSTAASDTFMGFRIILFQLAMISLGAGSVLFCLVLYKNRLVPRLLSGLGIVGYIALFISGWVEIFNPSPLGAILFVPGALFELAFPVWLFAKGFSAKILLEDEKRRVQ
jgi:hypothetical protein